MNGYDLFVSYSRRDNEGGRVTGLVGRISRDFEAFAGRPLRPFFDLEEIRGMDDWRHRILRGLRESRLLLALLSPSYLKSEYCEWEFNEYLKHEIGEGLVSEGIAPIYFIEVEGWTERNFEQRSAEWVMELRRRQHFDLQPWYDQGEEALRTQGVQERMTNLVERIRDRVRRGELREKAKGNVDRFNVNFSGRATEMRLLRESASLKQVGVLTAVQGLGGIGKTALACAYAHVYAAEYPGGCWQVKCEGRKDLRAALVSLAGVRDFEFEFSEEEKRDLDLGFERVVRELKKRADQAEPKRVLLILDNVDQPELLAPEQTRRLPSADWLHLIATTRLGEAELGRAPDRCFVAINELSEKDAVDLIEKWQPDGSFPNEGEREAAHGLARLLGGFTLAVEAAAVYLGQNAGEVTCAGFKARLEREGLGGLEKAVSDPAVRLRHEEKRLSATLQATLDRLSPPEKLALTYAALLPADYVVLPWLRPLAANEFPELGRDAEPGYADPWRKLLNRLISLRFFQLTAEFEIVRVHRLVQELVRQQADRGRLDSLETAVIVEVKKRGRVLFDEWVKPETRWELKPLAACAEHWMGKGRCETDGAYIATLTTAPMINLAQYADAEPLLRRALSIREKRFGPEDLDFALILNNLALLFNDTNRIAEAEALYRRSLAVLEKSLGPDHPKIASPLNNLAGLLDHTNRRAEAEPLYRRSMAIMEENLGPDHSEVALRLDNLANLLSATNRIGEAEALSRRALDIRERSLDPDHPDIAHSLNGLADLLKDTGRPAEAESLFRRALDIREKSLGPDHPHVAQSLNNLAGLLETDRPAEAEPLLRRALAIVEKSLGPDHPRVAQSLDNLAVLLKNSHRLAEAEALYRRALDIRERSLGPAYPEVATSLNTLANLLKETKRFAEAEPLYRRSLAIVENSLEPDHPVVAQSLNNLALLLEINRPAEAEPLYRRSLAIREKSLGPEHPLVAQSLYNLALLLVEMKRPSEAEPLFRRSLAMREKYLGPDHPNVCASLYSLADLLRDTGRPAEAEPLYYRALAIREKNFGPDDPSIAGILLSLKVLLARTNRLAEAEPLSRRAHAIWEKRRRPGDSA